MLLYFINRITLFLNFFSLLWSTSLMFLSRIDHFEELMTQFRRLLWYFVLLSDAWGRLWLWLYPFSFHTCGWFQFIICRMEDLLQHSLVPRLFGADIVLRMFVIARPIVIYRVDSCWSLLERLRRRIKASIFIVGTSWARKIVGLWVILNLVALISLLLRLFFVYLLWMHCWTFPLAFLVLQIPQVPNNFLAVIQINFSLIFFCNGPWSRRLAGLPIGFSVGLLMPQRRKILILIRIVLDAIALIGIPSIGKGMFELLDFFLSFDLIVTDLLVQHVSI